MCKRDKISTSGLQKKSEFARALIEQGTNDNIKAIRFQKKPDAKRRRVTDSLCQSAASRPKSSQLTKEFIKAEFADCRDFFFGKNPASKFCLSSMRTMEFPDQQIPAGNEDLGPYVTIMGIDRKPIISKFPLHIWRDYFYEGFEENIQVFSASNEWVYLPGQHFLVSSVPTNLYFEVQILFTQMANAKLDGTPLAIDPNNRAAEFFGLQQDNTTSLQVTVHSLSSEPFSSERGATSFQVNDGFLSSPEFLFGEKISESDDYLSPDSSLELFLAQIRSSSVLPLKFSVESMKSPAFDFESFHFGETVAEDVTTQSLDTSLESSGL
jgi:hypothetical protein